jgi:hypothetical protein
MRLRGDANQVLTIERSGFGEAGTPADEDLLRNITIAVGGYAAADQVWVVADDWRGFMREIRCLETTRQGHATLQGASPRDMQLVFRATDPAGRMAVSGFVGWNSPVGFYQKCEFGFAFDAGMLSNLVRELSALAR